MNKHIITLIIFNMLFVQMSTADAQDLSSNRNLNENTCGPLKIDGRHGPYDYRHPSVESRLDEVERLHFTPYYKAMMRGNDVHKGDGVAGYVANNFAYTLHAFPNHPYALQALDNYSAKKGFTENISGLQWSVECYFERAIRFKHEDSNVRFLYANYLSKRKRNIEAHEQLLQIESSAENNPQLAYNMGLVFIDLNDYERAKKMARIAYSSGFSLPGLRNKLVQLKQWDTEQ